MHYRTKILLLLVTNLFLSNLFAAENNVSQNYDFEHGIKDWFTYRKNKKDSAKLSISVDKIEPKNHFLKVQATGSRYKGPGVSVNVKSGNAYLISAMVKGEGSIVLAAVGSGGWSYSPPLKLIPDKWQKIESRHYEKGNKLRVYFLTYVLPEDSPEFIFYVDNLEIKQGKYPSYPDKDIEMLVYEAEKNPGIAKIIKDKSFSNGFYVEGKRQWGNYLASLKFPQTSKPVYIYLRCWLDALHNKAFYIATTRYKQYVYKGEVSEFRNWQWLKLGPITFKQVDEKFKIRVGIGKETVYGKLDLVIISTNANLTETQLNDTLTQGK